MNNKTQQKALPFLMLTLFYFLYFCRLNRYFLKVFYFNRFISSISSYIKKSDFIRLFKIFIPKNSIIQKISEFYFVMNRCSFFHQKCFYNYFLQNEEKTRFLNNLQNQGKYN